MAKAKKSVDMLMGNSLSRKAFTVINYTLISLMTIVCIFPLLHILSMSFSNSAAVEGGLVKIIPVDFTLFNYNFIIRNPKFYRAFFNSVLRVVLAVPISLLCTILIAYPLSKSKEKLRMRSFYVWVFIVTMLFNGGIVPTYMIVKYTGIYNTIWSMIIPIAVQVFNMLILMNFFRDLPKEIEEAAIIDGAGHFSILFKIFLPLSKPALATLTLFIFVNHWNSWFDGLIYFSGQGKQPLQTYLQTILTIPDTFTMSPQELMIFGKMSRRAINAAQIVVSTIPIMVVYPFLQKYYSKGLVLGSVKG